MIGSLYLGVSQRPWVVTGMGTILMSSMLLVGCDSSGKEITRGVSGTSKMLEQEGDFKVVGKGRSKRKEPLSREERLKRLRQLGRARTSEE